MKKKLSYVLIAFSLSINQLNAQINSVKITVGTSEFIATLENNPTANAFLQLLPLTINMSELGGVEKYYYFPSGTAFPTNVFSPGVIQSGDLMLYGNNCLVLFYQSLATSYSYTKIGKINNITGLTASLGAGNVQVTYELYNGALGVTDSKERNNSFQISPNPAKHHFQVSGGTFSNLSLLDLSGKTLLKTIQDTLNVENITAGIYFLKIDTGNEGIVTKKVIIEN